MPKFVDYPRGSLKSALEIANAVQELGGSCSIETCADHLEKKVSGSFRSQVSSAIKYNFINTQKGMLVLTSHYKKLSLAYSENERTELLRESFFNIPVFKSLYEKFANGKLPINMLDKILIREFDVANKIAGRVANYFINASREANLLNADNSFVSIENAENNEDIIESIEGNNEITNKNKPVESLTKSKDNYIITISGPGIQFQKEVAVEDDFVILNAIIQNIQKQIKQKNEIK